MLTPLDRVIHKGCKNAVIVCHCDDDINLNFFEALSMHEEVNQSEGKLMVICGLSTFIIDL